MAPALQLSNYSTLPSPGNIVPAYSSPLQFRPITLTDLPEIDRVLRLSSSLTCDYTIGGLYMWVDYFNYQFCIYRDTLFISGVEENHIDRMAFSCPMGALPLTESIGLLRQYCSERGLALQFSAVPADKLTCFTAFNPDCDVEELADWSDYVYEAEKFATLGGKKMAKKRNHVNRFFADYPQACLEALTPALVAETEDALLRWHSTETEHEGDNVATAREELREVLEVLHHLESFGFEGAVLRTSPGGEIVGFTLAEIIGDMAFVHIEKMNHGIAGAGESLAHLFVKDLVERRKDVRWLNREEDCGDEGLRRAKESWHPDMLLRKYNVTL